MPGKGLSHAYIISGGEVSRREKAREMCALMLCRDSAGERECGVCNDCRKVREGIHPDVINVGRVTDSAGKTKREIGVDRIRSIVSEAAILPNEGRMKVYVIEDAHTMNISAQNALLKILEEPPYFVSFLLLCENAGTLLETVRSRCVSINLYGDEERAEAKWRDEAEKLVTAYAGGSAVNVLTATADIADLGGDDMAELIDACIELLTDMLCGRVTAMGMERRRIMGLIGHMRKARTYLRFNVSAKHIAGYLSVCETLEK